MRSESAYQLSDWLKDIELESERALRSAHPGKRRTAARRIAGIALREMWKSDLSAQGGSFLDALRRLIASPEIPEDIRTAAARLEARLSPEFVSPSITPLDDAMLIVEYVKKIVRK